MSAEQLSSDSDASAATTSPAQGLDERGTAGRMTGADPSAPIDAPAEGRFAHAVPVAAIAVMTLATVIGNAWFGPPEHAPGIAALGAPYLIVATLGWVWGERRGRRAMQGVVVAMFALSVALLWASDLAMFLLVMPPLLLTVLYAGVRWAVAEIVALVAFAAVWNARLGVEPLEVYARATGFVPGAIMAVAFASVLVRERRAQRELTDLARVRERNRIARDIHDSVGHYLTVVHVQIEAARAIVARDPAGADECLGRAADLARDGLAELRRSVAMLRAPGERPFATSLAQLFDESRQAGVAVQLAIVGAPRPLGPAIEFALYCAAQEALTNIARHARATAARGTLTYGAAVVHLRITDDGAGADAVAGGFGLAGMRERVGALGGAVDVRTAPGQGFTLDVRVPS